MNERKKYLIILFIKKSSIYTSIRSSINKFFELLKSTYSTIPGKNIDELKEQFTINEYMEKLIPVIDKQLSEEELEEVIKFYSSAVGKKMLSTSFLKEFSQVDKNYFSEIEQKFSIENAKFI